MKLKTKEIQDFLKLAASITTTNIIPIVGYLKIEGGSISKTNLKTHISHMITVADTEKLLLDEKILVAFLRECKSEFIDVTVEGRTVWLNEGKRKLKFQSENISDFPKFPESDKEDEVELDSETLEAIGIAAKNVGTVGGGEPLDYVHIHDGAVFGTDRSKIYYKKVKGVPNMVLDTESANTISQFQSVKFYKKGTYNFFEAGNTVYAFIQTTAKTPEQVHSFIPKEVPKDFLEINVAEFVGFCDTVAAASPNKILDCTMDGNKLSFVDKEYDIDYDIELQTSGTYQPKLTFLPRLFSSFFKSLGITTAKITKWSHEGALCVWSDNDVYFTGIAMGTKNK